MKPNCIRRQLVVGVVLSLACAGRASVAQSLPEGRTAQDLRFLTGGVGLEESERMKALAQEFSLTVLVAAKSGAYLANTHLVIRDEQGRGVLDIRLDSPYLLVQLAAGRYDVEATHQGARKQQHVTVGPNTRSQVVFAFDVPVDQPRPPG